MSESPYPGLRPFEADEAYLFFGRDEQSDELLRRLRQNRFLAVIGTSGSGKSSLVRAGLLPSLHGGFMVERGSGWRVATLRPGSDPIGNLARALSAPEVLGAEEDADGFLGAGLFLETTLRRGSLGLVEATRQSRLPEGENLLVLVDQFEEIFRYRREIAGGERARDDAEAFVRLLLAAAEQQEVPIYVILTMRSDYLGDCAQFQDLPEAMNDGQYLIPRLTRAQLREVIQGPAAVGGTNVSPPLVQNLLAEVGDDPDQLPILQHALMRTWQQWRAGDRQGELELEHYQAIGGMEHALSRHADEALAELNERDRTLAMRIFQRLTEKGTDHRETRRPTRLDELCRVAGGSESEVIGILEVFRRPGRSFLMPPAGTELAAETVVDISHESLMRVWSQLEEWVEAESDSASIYRRLAESAALHEDGRAPLMTDPELSYTLKWRQARDPNAAWAERYGRGFERSIAFLRASEADRDRRQRTRARRRAGTIIALVAGLLVMAVLGFRARQEARRARLNSILVGANQAEDPLVQALLLSEIGGSEPPGAPFVRVAQSAASRALPRVVLGGEEMELSGVAISPDGERVATISADGLVRLWNADGTGVPLVLGRHVEPRGVAFDAAGERLLSWSENGTALLWSIESRSRLAELKKHARGVILGRFGPEGRMLTASEDGTVHVSTADGEALPPFRHRDLRSAEFAHQGEQIVTAGADGVRIWKAQGEEIHAWLFRGGANQAVFAPDDQRVAIASSDGCVRLWSPAEEETDEGCVGPEYEKAVTSVAFDADGQRLVTASERQVNIVPLRERRTRAPRVRRAGTIEYGLDGRVRDVIFSPDGSRVLSLSRDGRVSLHPARRKGPSVSLDHAGEVQASGFSAVLEDGGVAVVTLGGDVRVWRTPPRGSSFLLGSGAVLSRDGARAAGFYEGRTVVVDLAGGGEIRELGPEADEVRRLQFDEQGSHLAAVLRDRVVTWDLGAEAEGVEHEGRPRSDRLSFSPDGSLFRALYRDGWRIWRSDSPGEPLLRQDGSYRDAGFVPGGSRIWARTGDSLEVWGADAGEPGLLHRLPHGGIRGAIFSPDGSLVVTLGSEDLRLWRSADPGEPEVLGPASRETSVKFDQDGSSFLVIGRDAVQIWSADPPELERELDHLDARLAHFAPGARLVLTESRSETRIHGRDGSCEPIVLSRAREPVLDAEGRRLLVPGPDGIEVWDGSGCERLRTLEIEDAQRARFSLDEDWILVRTTDRVRLWRADREDGPIRLDHQGHRGAVFGPEGSGLVVTHDRYGGRRLWDPTTPEAPLAEWKVPDPEEEVYGFALGRDRASVLTWPNPRWVPRRSWRFTRIGWPALLAHLGRETDACLTVEQRLRFLEESPAAAARKFAACETERGRPEPRIRQQIAAGDALAKQDLQADAEREYRAAVETAAAAGTPLELEPESRFRQLAAAGVLAEGHELAEDGDWDGAVEKLRRAVEIEPDAAAETWSLLCRYGGIAGEAERVGPACERAVELEPENREYRGSRGLVLLLTGDRERAIEDFRYGVEPEDPRDGPNVRALSAFRRSSFARKRWPDALLAVRTLVDLTSWSAPRRDLLEMLVITGAYEEARQLGAQLRGEDEASYALLYDYFDVVTKIMAGQTADEEEAAFRQSARQAPRRPIWRFSTFREFIESEAELDEDVRERIVELTRLAASRLGG